MTAERPLFLVTGAAGFVGGHLVRHLLSRGHRVRAMVRSAARAGLQGLDVEVVEADLCEPATLRPAVDGVKGIYHIAGLFRQAGCPEAMFRAVNVDGVRNLFDAAIEAGVQRVIHCSTVGVFGTIENPPANEETPYNPGDVYQASKAEGERVALDYFRSGRMQGVVLRPGMIYGPGDARTLKLFRMIARRRFFYVGRGEAKVHWIDVRDLVRAFEMAMERTVLNGEVYIIAGQRAVPLREMAAEVARQLGVRPPWLCLPVKPMQWLGTACETVCRPLGIEPPLYRRRVDFYTKPRHFDTSKAARELGFAPAQTLEAEIADILADYRASGKL